MAAVGDIHVFVSDFQIALRFWSDGLGFEIAEQEFSNTTGFARLDAPDGGPSIHLFSGAQPWPESTRPAVGTRPTVRFDVVTADFDDTLVRLLEHGGEQVSEIETYSALRVVTVADPDGNSFELLEIPEGDGGDDTSLEARGASD